MKALLLSIYRALRGHFGHRDWWPGDTPFEVIVGAVLTQNAAWTNVEKAIARLKEAGALSERALANLPRDRLEELIRPSGYFRVKADRLLAVVAMLRENGGTAAFLKRPLGWQRERLLATRGVGPETADSILLYAANRPSFVVDAYTRRVFSRHSLVAADATYDEVQAFFEQSLPKDVALWNDYHAQIVELGKNYCRPRDPRCDACPLVSVPGLPPYPRSASGH